MRSQPDPPGDRHDDGTWQEFEAGETAAPPPPPPAAPAPPTDDTPVPSDDTPAPSDVTPSTAVRGTSPPGEGSREWDSAPAPVVAEGRVLFDKYRLIRKLGEGGMGQVWLVHNSELDCQSALKLLNPEVARNDRGWRRFKREAQLMRKLNHPNAVAVYDYKRAQSMGYIEMEYVRGSTVEDVLRAREGKPLTPDEIVPILDQLCSVLHEAHNHLDEATDKPKPIIHRDLKPSNLMLVERRPAGQNLKVLDFGIAKIVDEDEAQDQQLTNVGEFVGTVAYCSPEQIKGGVHKEGETPHEIDGRSDIYSVGVILYLMLTGSVPFRGGKMAVLAAHLTAEPPPPAKTNPKAKIPADVEQVVMQCLAKDPARRPPSARELADRFRAAAAKARPGLSPAVKAAAATAAVLAGLAAAYAVIAPPISKTGTNAAAVTPAVSAARPAPAPQPGRPPAPVGPETGAPAVSAAAPLWQPEGYEAVDTRNAGTGPRNEPARLRRRADRVEFYRFAEGVYLPVGYEPEDPSNPDLEGDWPRVIVRTRDRERGVDPKDWVRFVRVPGKTYRCGDVRLPPKADAEPVWVRVDDFYLQTTEVTNRLMEEYLETYPEDRERLKQWRDSAEQVKLEDAKNAGAHAANGLGLAVAWKCARYLGGRLPSEYEWEREAKAGGDSSLWSWGTEAPRGGARWAALDDLTSSAPQIFPQTVMKFRHDKTDHGVYDMTGNLREWCLDAYAPRAKAVPARNDQAEPLPVRPEGSIPADPDAIDPGQSYVVRGGSFMKPLDQAMVFLRDRLRPDGEETHFDVGVRVVIDCPSPPPPLAEPGR